MKTPFSNRNLRSSKASEQNNSPEAAPLEYWLSEALQNEGTEIQDYLEGGGAALFHYSKGAAEVTAL